MRSRARPWFRDPIPPLFMPWADDPASDARAAALARRYAELQQRRPPEMEIVPGWPPTVVMFLQLAAGEAMPPADRWVPCSAIDPLVVSIEDVRKPIGMARGLPPDMAAHRLVQVQTEDRNVEHTAPAEARFAAAAIQEPLPDDGYVWSPDAPTRTNFDAGDFWWWFTDCCSGLEIVELAVRGDFLMVMHTGHGVIERIETMIGWWAKIPVPSKRQR